jgi:probable HAF family extracellular repeat protein
MDYTKSKQILLIVGAIVSIFIFREVILVKSQVSDYVIYDLGTLGGDLSLANDINNNGQIVGDSLDFFGHHHAFIWENGEITDLGTLGGLYSIAYGINDNGLIVGYSYNTEGIAKACLWEIGVMTDLGTLGGLSSIANDIN